VMDNIVKLGLPEKQFMTLYPEEYKARSDELTKNFNK